MSKNAGKGSNLRPAQIAKDVFSSNWDAIFGKKKEVKRITIEAGTPCKWSPSGESNHNDGPLIGRITEVIDVTVVFTTPHGTTIKMGIVHAMRELSPLQVGEEAKLIELDRDAAAHKVLKRLKEMVTPKSVNEVATLGQLRKLLQSFANESDDTPIIAQVVGTDPVGATWQLNATLTTAPDADHLLLTLSHPSLSKLP